MVKKTHNTTPHFQSIFPCISKSISNNIFSTAARNETTIQTWNVLRTRILGRHSSLGLPMKFPIVGGLFLVYARPSGTGCTHAHRERGGRQSLSRTDYQEFPGTINLLAATPQAPFPSLPFFTLFHFRISLAQIRGIGSDYRTILFRFSSKKIDLKFGRQSVLHVSRGQYNGDTIRRDKGIGARHFPRDLDLRVEINYRRRRCGGQLTGRACP